MKDIKSFIWGCTDSWHTVYEVCKVLDTAGYKDITDEEAPKLNMGEKYYVTRNKSSVIAFELSKEEPKSFMIAAAHGESPSFKVKAVPELSDKNYIRLNTEAYGGMIPSTWFDRPLSVSGRVVIDEGDSLSVRLVNLNRDALVIPSVAPHLSRGKDLGDISISRDMPPLYALAEGECDLLAEVAELAGTDKDKLMGCDLMLYNREEARVWGKNDEFISAPRLDDLQCVYALLGGLVESGESLDVVKVMCVFDNEEVGSGTKQGAKSDFLSSTLRSITEGLGMAEAKHRRMLDSSFLVSADNAHALNPNRPEVYDSNNRPLPNNGVVIKYNAAQRYTTDGVSEAVFKRICKNAGVPFQVYANKSDIGGGSTLGNLAVEKTCINAVDVGLAQLAMHSAYETAGNKDTEYLKNAVKELYNTSLAVKGDKIEVKKG